MLKRICIALTCICSVAFAADSQPTEASIKELLKASDAAKLIDSATTQIDGMVQNVANQVTQSQPSPEVKKIVDNMKAKTAAIIKAEINWALFEPIYIRVYQKAFTQEEVDGMIAFYSSAAGKAIVGKMPQAMQTVMAESQGLMRPIMMKLQGAQQEMMKELQAEMEKAKAQAPVPAETPAAAATPAPVAAPATAK